jgi:MFS family permease
MAAEHDKDHQRGFCSSWPQAGVPLGNLLATGVLFLLAAVQSDDTFEAWGWRIPFLLSAVLVLIGLYVRLQLEESPVYKEAKAQIADKKQESSHMPILEVIRTYPKEVLIAMGMRMAENISYYIFTVVVIAFAKDFAKVGTDLILQMLLIGAAFQFLLIPAVGALSDRIGRRPLYLVGAVGVAFWSFFFLDLAGSEDGGKILLAVVVGLFFHSLMYSPQAAFFSELFGTSVRYTGASVGYQLASIFAGALAPIIAVQLLKSGDGSNTTAVALYVTAASVITVIAVLFAKETRSSSLRHDRVVRGAHD